MDAQNLVMMTVMMLMLMLVICLMMKTKMILTVTKIEIMAFDLSSYMRVDMYF